VTISPGAVPSIDRPYKGPQSYQPEDAGLFFGRDGAADELAAMVLSSRLSILHAQSGAGKTSLLNARLGPILEARGWTPVRVLPCNDPVASAREAVLACIAPPPSAEAAVLRRARDWLCGPSADPCLADLIDRYDRLATRDTRKRLLISPVDADGWAPGGRQTPILPFAARLLRSSVDLAAFNEHLGVVITDAGPSSVTPGALEGGARVGALLALLDADAAADSHQRLLKALDPPVPGLRAFFSNLFQVYGQRRSRFGLVVLLDQFEELFTRFVDAGAGGHSPGLDLPDWRLRWEFLHELEGLFAPYTEPEDPAADAHLPLRGVISLRSEYLAQIEPIRRFAPEIDKAAFHLRFLTPDEARVAIRAPASEYGYGYSDECFEQIILDLTKEGRFIEPTHLQIVCEKLWDARGRELAVDGSARCAGRRGGQVDAETYDSLGRAAGIMRGFFDGYLDRLGAADRVETLELLEPLITASGTRNIIERDRLLRAPLRDPRRREALLLRLVASNIVRVETRLGGHFVEVTHEFLISAIRDALHTRLYADKQLAQLRMALQALERGGEAWQTASATDERLLEQDFRALHEHRPGLDWQLWAIELMLRESIRLGVEIDVMRVWVDAYRTFEESRP
jgi:hypothetical protein